MQQTNTSTRERYLLNLAGSLSVTAALIHFIVVPEHLEEWWGYGLFFIIIALAQLVFGAALLLRSWNPGASGVLAHLWDGQAHALYFAGVAANLALIILFAVTRTVGVPVGPAAGELEPFSTISVAAQVVELGLVGCLMWLTTPLIYRNSLRVLQ